MKITNLQQTGSHSVSFTDSPLGLRYSLTFARPLEPRHLNTVIPNALRIARTSAELIEVCALIGCVVLPLD